MSQINQLNYSMDLDDAPTDEMRYEIWLNKVATIVYENLRMNLDDLPDEKYRINFDDGMSPEDMAKIVIGPINEIISETVGKFFK